MRIQQFKVPTNWVGNSDDPGRSLDAYVQGAWNVDTFSEYLVDDQRLGVPGLAHNKMLVNSLDDSTGIAFAAKDGETLERGFGRLLKKVGATNQSYRLHSAGLTGLTAFYIEWSRGSIRSQTQIGAAIATIGHNAGEGLKRLGIMIFPSKAFLKRHGVTIDHFMSVSQAMKQAGRDGKMLVRGACLYVCASEAFANAQPKWGRVWRQLGSTIDLGDLKRLTARMRA